MFIAQNTDLAGTSWQVLSYNNGRQAVVSVINGTTLTANFGQDGQLSGNASCNNYTAEYTTDGKGSITIGTIGVTMMMCVEPEGVMEQEQQYLAALTTAATYRIDGDKLELRTADGALAAQFIAATAASAAPEPPVEAATAEAPLSAETPAATTQTVVTLADQSALGKLNGQPVAAVVVITDSGGSGTFYDLAVVAVLDGRPVYLATKHLGDRVKINSVTIQDNRIAVDMITQGPQDPMCCPTQHVVQRYQLEGDQLVQVQS
jgi:heat shock protein HslJ